MTRIFIAEPDRFSADALGTLRSLGDVRMGPVDRAGLLREVSGAHVLVVRLGHRIDREIIAAAPSLVAIASPTTGIDHIDVDFAAERGVRVISLGGELEFLRSITSTAEHTWALLLALARQIPDAHAHVLMGGWDRDRYRGTQLSGMRLGIVGLGRVGEQVARYANAFGMRVNAYDPQRRETWPPGVEPVSSLAELAARTDILTVHVPLAKDTERLLSKDIIAALPRGAFILNTSRGGVVDEAAVLAALSSGHLGGAALDVLVDEHDVARRAANPLVAYARENSHLILTPHIAGATHQAMAATESFIADRLAAALAGGAL